MIISYDKKKWEEIVLHKLQYLILISVLYCPSPAGTGTVKQSQTWGRKALGFGCTTFGWASCTIVQQGVEPRLMPDRPLPENPTIIDLRVSELVSNPVKSCLVGDGDKYRHAHTCTWTHTHTHIHTHTHTHTHTYIYIYIYRPSQVHQIAW